MSWKQLAGKGTWLGTATAAVVLLAAFWRASAADVWPYGRAAMVRCLGRWQYPPVYMVQCGSRR